MSTKTVTVREPFSFDCIFCKGKVTVGKEGEGYDVILHTMPHCPQFEKMEPADYIKAHRTRNY